jgi:type VI secretion system secreted protein VgrG
VPLVTDPQEVDPQGIGAVHAHGDHYWTPEEGTMLASIRAQELLARKVRMQAMTTVRGLRAGHRFRLDGAEPEVYGLATEYVVVAIDHFAEGGEHDADLPYYNRVELQPASVAFRPARTTPKPRIHGVVHAKIDAEAEDEVNVPVDEWGRYKVVMPFDVAGEPGGRSSCWIRLANPSGGGGWGFAQGLHTGTEVVLYHLDGDPDRPVIAGAVSNFEQPSTVRSENAQQGVISSRHGITVTLSDA